MSMSDPIADMLTRIRNAGKARFKSVEVPGSNLKREIARVLKEEGYIKTYKFIEDGKQGILKLELKYDDSRNHIIYRLERISKPSRREYHKAKDVKPVYNGLGLAILSTSKGIMSDKKARKENVGGEMLCQIW
jgi:small subunit ribosomal protein S8